MRIHLGSDHAGVELRRHLAAFLTQREHQVSSEVGPRDADSKVDYPDVAFDVARRVAGDAGSLGLLVCGSGQGVAMAANKVEGIRAAVCGETYSASMARAHNDANVLCLGQRVVGVGVAEAIVQAFLSAEFEGGRHQARVTKINAGG